MGESKYVRNIFSPHMIKSYIILRSSRMHGYRQEG